MISRALSIKSSITEFISSKQLLILFLLCIFTFVSVFIAIGTGSYDLSIINFILGRNTGLQNIVLLEIRVPRVILSAIVGASLGIAGAALQGLFRNPLADPGLIGVSAGAALGATTIIVIGANFFPNLYLGSFLLPVAAISGACFVIFMLYVLTKGFGYQGVTYMLLVGIAVNAIAGVGIGILTYISSDAELRSLTFWTMGSFGGVTWPLLILSLIHI